MTAHAVLAALQARRAQAAVVLPPLPPPAPVWRGILVAIAGEPILVAMADVEAIVATPSVTRVPGASSWLLGIAPYQGGLLPVICGDSLFGPGAPARAREYCLVLRQAGIHCGITLGRVEGMVRLPLAARVNGRLPAGALAGCCSGGFDSGERFLGLLDSGKLAARVLLAETVKGRSSALREGSA